jgi:hypothetical protein
MTVTHFRHLEAAFWASFSRYFYNIPFSFFTKHQSATDTRATILASMADAFANLGNHLISDSASTIRAGPSDDISNIDPDEALLYGGLGRGARGARRRTDDDDNETEAFDDDDESLASVPVNGLHNLKLQPPEEEKELPAHACA